jgi:hypothetical protein
MIFQQIIVNFMDSRRLIKIVSDSLQCLLHVRAIAHTNIGFLIVGLQATLGNETTGLNQNSIFITRQFVYEKFSSEK